MVHVFVFVSGVLAGGSAVFIWYLSYVGQTRRDKRELQTWRDRLHSDSLTLTQQRNELENRRQHFEQDIQSRRQQLDHAVATFEARKVQYDDLLRENTSLKQDLFNLGVQVKKMERDHAAIVRGQEELDRKANELAQRYLDENVSWISQKLTSKNFATCKKRLTKVVERCRDVGFDVSEKKEETLVQDLRTQFERAVRAEFEREEQARIRAQIREEERLAREVEKQIQEAEREQAAIQIALERALQEAKEEHSAEVEHLRAKLKEAEEKMERAKSRAQMTRSGHVYVLSNMGSFGEGVYKIGLTRRLEPMDRVRELGDASVPFPFDVHMMISSDDAPTLENALHREFHGRRVNRVNFRKEYFRVDIESIRRAVEAHHGEVDYVADSEALQYRESLDMNDEDYSFVEHTVQSLSDDEDIADVDE
ncbi:MAG TPA: GIY-YIG nuclease family protein [Thermoguttaceae bacterium]|nr:GIY-YIG nuclease family protein [Thermoguttaceae bacterium]